MDFVPVELNGRTYRLRFTADDIQDICRRLTAFQPAGGSKVTPVILSNLLLNLDPDAFQFCFWAGLRHMTDYKHLDPADAQKIIRDAIRDGTQYADLRRPIFRCLIACGFAEFAPVVKILEDVEEQQRQDALSEADLGNVGNPLLGQTARVETSNSMMKASMPDLRAERSESSM